MLSVERHQLNDITAVLCEVLISKDYESIVRHKLTEIHSLCPTKKEYGLVRLSAGTGDAAGDQAGFTGRVRPGRRPVILGRFECVGELRALRSTLGSFPLQRDNDYDQCVFAITDSSRQKNLNTPLISPTQK